MDDEKRVLGVFGLGAIGTVIAHCLKPSPQAFYFNRSAKHSLPLLLENQQLHLDVKLSTASESLALDWLLICLKEYHYEHAISDLAKIIKPNTKVAVIRNGLNLKSPLLAIVQEDQILETMIDCPTQWSSNGYYHALRLPRMTTEQNALGEAFLELFQNDRIRIEQTRDFKTASWEKLIESATLGAILSLSGESAWIFKDDNLVRIYEQLLDESILVAREDGANLDESLKKNLLIKLREYPPHKESSMLIDRRLGRPIEINAKNGVISQLAKKYGLKAPLNELVTQLLKYTNQLENQNPDQNQNQN